MLSHAKIDPLRSVAQAIIDSGYAEPARPYYRHMHHACRVAQLRECRTRFIEQFGYEPMRKELAIMAGVSRQTVTRVLGASK